MLGGVGLGTVSDCREALPAGDTDYLCRGVLLLLLLFVLVPIAEIYVIIQVGQEIGALWTVLILIVDSLIGARLLSWQGRRRLGRFQPALGGGRVPTARSSTAC